MRGVEEVSFFLSRALTRLFYAGWFLEEALIDSIPNESRIENLVEVPAP